MKQEALEVLRNRRAIRSYKEEQVPADLLQKVLEMGTYAPTAGGRQKPYIVAVQDPETRTRIPITAPRRLSLFLLRRTTLWRNLTARASL